MLFAAPTSCEICCIYAIVQESMATKTSKSAQVKKKRTSSSQKAKSSTSVRDIKPAKKDTPKRAFTIKQLDEDAPEIEPLMEDVDFLEHEITDMESETENLDVSYEPTRKPAMRVSSVTDLDDVDSMDDVPQTASLSNLEDIPPKDIIKVKFGTFVNLVANHDMEDVVSANADKDIIMDSNLLTELASSRDQREERKIPLVFLVGIAIGVVLTYIFFST